MPFCAICGEAGLLLLSVFVSVMRWHVSLWMHLLMMWYVVYYFFLFLHLSSFWFLLSIQPCVFSLFGNALRC